MTFAETGVIAPGPDVWSSYARAAVEALRATIEENLDRPNGPFRTDRHDAIIDFLTYDVLE